MAGRQMPRIFEPKAPRRKGQPGLRTARKPRMETAPERECRSAGVGHGKRDVEVALGQPEHLTRPVAPGTDSAVCQREGRAIAVEPCGPCPLEPVAVDRERVPVQIGRDRVMDAVPVEASAGDPVRERNQNVAGEREPVTVVARPWPQDRTVPHVEPSNRPSQGRGEMKSRRAPRHLARPYQPPSMPQFWPEIMSDAGDTRKWTRSATCSGWIRPFRLCRSSTQSL